MSAGQAGDAPDADDLGVVIPDDARELALEAEALRRERAAAARRERWSRLVITRRYRQFGLSGPLVLLALLVVAIFGALLTLLVPRPAGLPLPATLASSPVAAPGLVGGLLPEAALRVGGAAVPARELRPAVLVLLPSGCDCPQSVAAVARQAAEFRLPARLVQAGPAITDETLAAARAAGGAVLPLADPAGALAEAYATGDGLTVLAVAADGVVAGVEHDVTPGTRLEPLLQDLTARR